MRDDAPTLDDGLDDVTEIPSHARPEWIKFIDGERWDDRPRNLREWIRMRILRRPRTPT